MGTSVAAMSGEVYIMGHSLGGSRTWNYAYSRVVRGLRVDGIYALAPARPGDHVIGQTLFKNRAKFQAVRALWNMRDIVPALPIDLEIFDEEFEQPWRLDEITEPNIDAGYVDIDPNHNIACYIAGAKKLPAIPGVAITLGDAADLIARLYVDATGWDWINPVNGSYWAMKVMPNGAKAMIARGTKTAKEWLLDFDAIQIDVLGARMSRGFWSGVGPIEAALDAALA